MERQKILIVDDTPENLQLLYRTLREEYDLFGATSGREALAIAASHRPDLILLDIMMPEMDGYEVCRRLKSSEELRDIPVLFLTALSEDSDELRGLEIGAVDYITKPFKTAVVKRRIETHLALKRKTDQLARSNAELREALENVRALSGLLPICSKCKKIRDDQGYWKHVEPYISLHSDVLFSHGYCPECATKAMDDLKIQLERSSPRSTSTEETDRW